MNLYAARRPGLFLLFIPCMITTVLPLLAWSLVGLLLIIPGVIGLSGLWGLLLGWTDLLDPDNVARHRTRLQVLLIMGLCVSVLGIGLGFAAGTTSNGTPDFGYMGLGLSSLCYACVAAFFLKGLPPAAPTGRILPEPAPQSPKLGLDYWAVALFVATVPPLVSVLMLLASMESHS